MREADPNVQVESEFLNAAAVGQMLGGMTPPTVRKLAKEGVIPASFNLGDSRKLVFWRRSEIETYARGEQPSNVSQLQQRIAELERRVAELEAQQPKPSPAEKPKRAKKKATKPKPPAGTDEGRQDAEDHGQQRLEAGGERGKVAQMAKRGAGPDEISEVTGLSPYVIRDILADLQFRGEL